MKILLMGEYSNVHATLAEGLRKLGHQVTVLSNGDFWKNYPRDIDLVRKPGKTGRNSVYDSSYTQMCISYGDTTSSSSSTRCFWS